MSSNSHNTNFTNTSLGTINTFFNKIGRGEFDNQPFGTVLESDNDSDMSAASSLRYRNVGDFVNEVGKIRKRQQRRLNVLKRLEKKEKKKMRNPIVRFLNYLSRKMGKGKKDQMTCTKIHKICVTH